jgi:hypothetical protein
MRKVRACAKVAYASQRDANIAMGHVATRKRRDRRGSMHAHRCRACGLWHIGVEIFMNMPAPKRMAMMAMDED